MRATRHDQRGSVLIIAVIAMLILGVLSLSFALLSRLETTIGVNYKTQGQAEALAEAALEKARDVVRSADAEPCGFTRWTDTNSDSYTGCGSYLGGSLPSGAALGAGSYSAIIENDCAPLIPVPAMTDSNCSGATPSKDNNQIAVVTAWATAANGQGRARVRGILGIDNPWRHVCSDSSQNNAPGYCNEPANRNGSPTIVPADPNEYPGGPQAYDDLPLPQLGCSDIDPSVHGAGSTLALAVAACQAWRPYPNYLAQSYQAHNVGYPNIASAPRLVVTGDRSKTNCDGGGVPYQGYFDCALTTPCDNAVFGNTFCGGPTVRKGCVKAGDTRATTDPSHFVTVNLVTGCGVDTGMVFRAPQPSGRLDWPNINYIPGGTTGANARGVLIYVMRGQATDLPTPWTGAGSCCVFEIAGQSLNGTVVIEGNGTGPAPGAGPVNCAGDRDLWHKNGARVFTQSRISWDGTTTDYGPNYGYPLAYLIFDPVAAKANAPQPTANPLNQQNTCADMGSAAGTEIHGLIYSGGNVEFNPIVVDGGMVAFQIHTQSTSATYNYNNNYADQAPPAGFPISSGNTVVLVRKSFVVCGNYDTGSTLPCQ